MLELLARGITYTSSNAPIDQGYIAIAIRQSAAAVVGPKDQVVKNLITPTDEAVEAVEAPKAARKAPADSRKEGKAGARK